MTVSAQVPKKVKAPGLVQIMGSTPVEGPPPPPVKPAPLPVTPKEIRVGKERQSYAMGLGTRWINFNYLSDQELAQWEQRLAADPENIYVHARLIASYRYPHSDKRTARLSHLLWMIQRHPDWDGFAAAPLFHSMMAQDASTPDPQFYEILKNAWMRHLNAEPQRGAVLHNVAMFFALSEPDVAVSALTRAIALEPNEPLYQDPLGVIYAYSLIDSQDLVRAGVVDSTARVAFAQKARSVLEASENWIVLRSAADTLHLRCGGWPCGAVASEQEKSLLRRWREKADALSPERDLPSKPYTHPLFNPAIPQ